MEINRDGTFTGQYLDSKMDATGEGYPRGSAYICDFSGVFSDIEKINEYTYQMRLSDVTVLQTAGKEWVKNEIRYIASNPVGIYDPENEQLCEAFILYLPDTPVNQLPQKFLSSWPYQDAHKANPKATLSCYGFLNVTTNDGFFYVP